MQFTTCLAIHMQLTESIAFMQPQQQNTITKIPSKWSTIITRAIQLMLLTTIHVHSNENERFSFQ